MISNYYGLFGLYEVPLVIIIASTVLFLVVVNAINFIDGIDGLAISEIIKVILVIELFSYDFTALSNLGILIISSLNPTILFYTIKSRQVKYF